MAAGRFSPSSTLFQGNFGGSWRVERVSVDDGHCPFFLFFITLKLGVGSYTKSLSLKYEPASEPLHISVKGEEVRALFD